MIRRLLVATTAAGTALAILAYLAWQWWTVPVPVPAFGPGWPAAVRTIAGDGIPGDADGPADRARFRDPFGIAAARDGTIYVTDAHRIRRIAPDGTVSTLAGGGEPGFADGPGAAARFDTPSALAIDAAGTLYVADTGNHAIRRITPDGRVTTLAGSGEPGLADGTGRAARFNGPVGIALDPAGRVIVADTYNDRIRAIGADGRVETMAGGPRGGPLDGPAHEAAFDTPAGVAADAAGILYVADTGGDRVARIDRSGTVATLALPAAAGAGPGGLSRPLGIAASPDGHVYVSDRRAIAELAPDGTARVLAGSRPGFADGPGAEARFRNPSGLAWAGDGRLAVADTGNALVRLVAAPWLVPFGPPASPRIAPGFDAEGFAWLPLLWPVHPMAAPHDVAGTFGEARGDAGGEGRERFHAGIDVREPEGTPVLAVREGMIVHPVSAGAFGSINEWVSLGPIGYVHLRVGRDRRDRLFADPRFAATYDAGGRLAGVRVRRGARFRTGDAIGTINRFNHVHLSVGWPGEEHNPLGFRLPGFEDRSPPTIAPRGITLLGEDGSPLRQRERGRLLVRGRARIIVDAWDRMDANPDRRRLGVYRLGYQVLHADGRPADGFASPLETIRFDVLAPDRSAPPLVYAPGSGIAGRGRRTTRFLYTVTTTFRGGVAAEGHWDTAQLEPGDYVLRILAADIRGNIAIANRDLPVRIVR
jgi:DNA-binding beta-propeller fold protein YncE